MKIISQEDIKNMRLKQRGNISPAYSAMVHLEKGQHLHLEPGDWNQKGSPSTMMRSVMKKYKREYTCAKILNEPGWLITRIS